MLLLLLASAIAMPSEKEVQAEYDRVRPVVQEVVGRPLKAIPRLRYAHPGEAQAVIEAELREQLANLYPGLAGWMREALAHHAGGGALTSIIGKYGYQSKSLFVRPRGIAEAAASAKLSDLDEVGVLDVVLAHELAHAVQDQEVDLGARFRAAADTDAWAALNAALEGHAVLVATEVARRLGEPEAAATVGKLQGLAGDGSTEVSPQLWFNYHTGAEFVAAAAPDPLRPWALLAAPPTTTGQVFVPSRYGQPWPDLRRDPSAWTTAAADLGVNGWTTYTEALGELALRTSVPTDAPTLEAATASLGGGDSWHAGDERGRSAEGEAWTSVDEAGAAALYATLEARAEAVAAGAPRSPVPMTFTGDVRTATSLAYTVVVTPSSGLPGEAHGLVTTRGPHTVSLEVFGLRPRQGAMAAAMEAVLGCLEAVPAQ